MMRNENAIDAMEDAYCYSSAAEKSVRLYIGLSGRERVKFNILRC